MELETACCCRKLFMEGRPSPTAMWELCPHSLCTLVSDRSLFQCRQGGKAIQSQVNRGGLASPFPNSHFQEVFALWPVTNLESILPFLCYLRTTCMIESRATKGSMFTNLCQVARSLRTWPCNSRQRLWTCIAPHQLTCTIQLRAKVCTTPRFFHKGSGTAPIGISRFVGNGLDHCC